MLLVICELFIDCFWICVKVLGVILWVVFLFSVFMVGMLLRVVVWFFGNGLVLDLGKDLVEMDGEWLCKCVV